MMSDKLKTTVLNKVSLIIIEYPEIITTSNLLHPFERECLAEMKSTEGTGTRYTFTPELFIELKIVLFGKIFILKTVGFTYVGFAYGILRKTGILRLLPPQNEIQTKIQTEISRLIVEKIEYDLTPNNAINLLNCTLIYRDSKDRYNGNVRIDEVMGFQKHGLGGFSMGACCRYLYDYIDYDCLIDPKKKICRCVFCRCTKVMCNFNKENKEISMPFIDDCEFYTDLN